MMICGLYLDVILRRVDEGPVNALGEVLEELLKGIRRVEGEKSLALL